MDLFSSRYFYGVIIIVFKRLFNRYIRKIKISLRWSEFPGLAVIL